MKRFKKKEYVISAEKEIGREVYNFLEDVHYTSSEEKPIILTGTAGEQWVVDEAKLRKTYTLENGNEIDKIPDGKFTIKTKPDTGVIFAERITEQVEIATSWGDVLKANRDDVPHGDGDYIVYAEKDGQPNPQDRWVVNGVIFPKTYVEVKEEI